MSIKTKVIHVEKEVTESLSCDNCGVDIPLVFEDTDSFTLQGRQALQLHLDGGYGMYIDPIGQPRKSMLWCKDCADKLAKAFPSIAKCLRG